MRDTEFDQHVVILVDGIGKLDCVGHEVEESYLVELPVSEYPRVLSRVYHAFQWGERRLIDDFYFQACRLDDFFEYGEQLLYFADDLAYLYLVDIQNSTGAAILLLIDE